VAGLTAGSAVPYPRASALSRPDPVRLLVMAGARARKPSVESESAVYAIVRSGGNQQKVSVGDVIDVDRLDAEAGSTVTLPAVLLVDGETVTTDPKKLSGVSVTAEIVGDVKGPKIHILRFKNKTGYRRRQGHRQRYTQVKVTGIETKK
jgi:large subunit ribosomal protein L21